MLDQRPLLYKGRTQIAAALASLMKHLVAAVNFDSSISARGSQRNYYMYVATRYR